MPCTCIKFRVVYRCRCNCSDPNRVSIACGRTQDARGRRTFCPGADKYITQYYMNEYCSRPAHQRRRFNDGDWKCCQCDLDNQIRDKCDNCAHRCCSSCTQGRLPVAGPSSSAEESFYAFGTPERLQDIKPNPPQGTSQYLLATINEEGSQSPSPSSSSGRARQSPNLPRKKARLTTNSPS